MPGNAGMVYSNANMKQISVLYAPTAAAATNDITVATTAFVATAVAAVSSGSGYAPLAGAAFTGAVSGTTLALSTSFAAGGALTTKNTATFYTGYGFTGGSGATTAIYGLAQFGTVSPLNILQTANSAGGGVSAFTGMELASNNSWSGTTRTATVAGYAQSIGFDTTNGVLNFYSTAASQAAGTVLTGPGGNLPRVAYITAAGAATFSSYVSAYGFNGNGGYFNNAVIGGTSGSPYIQINTSDTGRNAFGIKPSSASVGIANTNTYSYTASMSNDPASAATASVGPTMELSLFASIYTGNAAAKTILRSSANSGLMIGNSTITASGTAPTAFPKLSFGTNGLASGYTIVSEYAMFAANTGNLMLFTSTAMAADSAQTDSGARLQVYGTSYFSGNSSYGGVLISGVTSAEYGTGEINRQITASAIGAGSNYSTWYRGSTQMGTYGYSDTATDVLYFNNALGNVSINGVTVTTAGVMSVATAVSGTNTTQAASTAFVKAAIAAAGTGGSTNYSNFVSKETPSGAVNGTNTAFVLANAVLSGSEQVFLNGLLQDLTTDYTISSSTITFVLPPYTGDSVRVTYII